MDEFSASDRMNQYETGGHVPDYSTLKLIATVINLPEAYADSDELAQLINLYSKLEKIINYC